MSKTSIPIFNVSKKNSMFRYKKQSRDEVQESYGWPSLSTKKVPATDLKGNELFKVSSNSTLYYCEKVKSALEGKNESKLKIKLNGPGSRHCDDVANHFDHIGSLLEKLRGSSCKVLVLNPYTFECINKFKARNFLSFNELEISEKIIIIYATSFDVTFNLLLIC